MPLYSTASLNLDCSLVFSSTLSIRSFHNWKEPKGSVTGKISHNSLLLTSRKRHPSVGCYLPTNPFILFLGGAELLQLATRQSERLTSSQTVLTTLSKNRMGFVCDFDGDGFYLKLPIVRVKFANYATIHCKGNPSLKAKVASKRAKAKHVWAFAASMSNLSKGQHCDKLRVARCEPTEEYCSSWADAICEQRKHRIPYTTAPFLVLFL